MRPRLTTGLACLVLAASCGASPRMVHQSVTYFELCHSADLDPERTLLERRECWSRWLEHYRTGQPPERIAYARDRMRSLQRGETLRPLPGAVAAYTAAYVSLGADSPPNQSTQDTSEIAPQTTEIAPEPNPEPASAEQGQEQTSELEHAEQPIAEQEPSPDPSRVRPPAPPRIPPSAPIRESSSPCLQICNPRWDQCVDRCEGRGGNCVNACRVNYRVCMRGCY